MVVDGHVDVGERGTAGVVGPNRVLGSRQEDARCSADVAVTCIEVERRARIG